MSQNGIEGDLEIQIEQEPSTTIIPDDEELQIVEDGSNPYKKMKLNMEGNQKRKAQDVLEISSDEGDAAGDSLRHKGDPSSAPQGQEEKKKKKKKSSKREKDPDHEEHGEKSEKKKDKDKSKKKKKKDKEEGVEGIEAEAIEKKKKKKKKKDREKEKEKHKDGDDDGKEKKKKKKKKDRADKDKSEKSEKDKEKEKKKKREKEQEIKEKKMQEFEKKYPKYIQKGKIKFPIDDVLFILYDSILGEHIPKIKKPTAHHGLISPQELGDILQIWNFFTSFPELTTLRNLSQEEIFACLKYTGEENLALVDRMHYEILFVFVREFLKKNRFETYKDEVENPFFILIKCYVGYEEPISEELSLIWTELYKYITHLSPYGDYTTLTLKRYVEILAERTFLNYNKLEYKVKVKVLIELINSVYDTEVFRDCLQEKMDQVTGLIKERNELLQEIKQDEQEYYDLKAKVELTEKTHREEEEKWEQLARSEVIRRQKELENDKKEFQKTLSALTKVEGAKERKQTRVEEIVASLNGNVETATRLGQDSNKSEYWIFQGHTERLYVKLSPIVYPEDTWMFFDEKAELDQLLEALNPKAIKEKALLEKLKEVVAHGQLNLKDIKIEEGESTTTGVTAATEKKKDELDLNFWYAKVLDYHPPVEVNEEGETIRTTRSRAHELAAVKPQNPRPKETKFLTLDGVKELLERTENTLTQYLDKWGARWANPKVKEDLKKRIKEAQTPKELAGLLVELEKNFQYSETPLRQKTLEEGGDELDNPEELEDDEEDEEDDQYYEEEEKRRYEEQNRDEEHFYGSEDEEDSRNKRRPRGRSERESEADDDDIKIRRKGAKRMEIEDDEDEPKIRRKGGSRKQSKYEEEEVESRRSEKESRIEEEVASQVSHQREASKEEAKPMETEAPSQEEKKEGEQPAAAATTEGGEPQEKVKKMAVKVWGRANERTKRCWMVYVKTVDNTVGLLFAAAVFCDLVEIYVAKKNEKYFSDFKTVAEYLAAKRDRKQNASKPSRNNEQKVQKQQKEQLDRLRKQREDRANNRQFGQDVRHYAQPDSPEGYRIKKRGDAARDTSGQARKNGGGSDANPKRIRKLRDQTSDRSESEPEEESYNPRQQQQERARAQVHAKQDQLNELANVRRSTRLTRRSELPAANETEYEEKECLDCGRTVPEEEAVVCSMCENAFHLDCAGLKVVPDDKYTCINCWQKLASSRQTRSTTRKLH